MKRKVISMQTVVVTENDPDAPGGSYWMLKRTALCDDGTMWYLGQNDRYQDEWKRLPDVPED